MANSEWESNSWFCTLELYVHKIREAIGLKCAHSELRVLLTECLNAYSEHLNVSTVDGALAVLSGYGCSPVEIAFTWMGRWRPTSAVVLAFTTMGPDVVGVQKANKCIENLSGMNSLSDKQVSALNNLQKHACQEESDLSQQLASFQMLLVEQSMVAALHVRDRNADLSDFQKLLDEKLKQLQTLLVRADNLRLYTLKVLLNILTPVQAATCGLEAYELVYALKSLGTTAKQSSSAGT